MHVRFRIPCIANASFPITTTPHRPQVHHDLAQLLQLLADPIHANALGPLRSIALDLAQPFLVAPSNSILPQPLNTWARCRGSDSNDSLNPDTVWVPPHIVAHRRGVRYIRGADPVSPLSCGERACSSLHRSSACLRSRSGGRCSRDLSPEPRRASLLDNAFRWTAGAAEQPNHVIVRPKIRRDNRKTPHVEDVTKPVK